MKAWIMGKIEYWLGVDILWGRLSDLEDKYRALEEGIMHDDFPKCSCPENSGFYVCKHGRCEFKSKKKLL